MRTSNIISVVDRNGLQILIDSARLECRLARLSLDALEGKLTLATIVDSTDVPRDVITMDSTVWFRDVDTEEIESCQLVYPSDADLIFHRVSVLSPIGTALLGCRLRDVVEWQVPRHGRRCVEITKVLQLHAAQETASRPIVG
jgi:regulator of nucleoside diphosphate kinase